MHTETETSFLGLEQVQGLGITQTEYPDRITCTYELASGKGSIYSIWPRELAFFIIERQLGGSGEQLFMDKALSEFEKTILMRFSKELILSFQSGFEKTPAPEIGKTTIIEGLEPFAEQMPFEILLLGRLTIRIKKYQGAIVMVMPYSLAKPWIDDGHDDQAESEPQGSWKESALGIASSMAKAPLFLTVKMSGTPIKVNDFTNLQIGDCILLNQSVHDPVDVYIENRMKYKGYMGTVGSQLALKVSSKVKQTENKSAKNKK